MVLALKTPIQPRTNRKKPPTIHLQWHIMSRGKIIFHPRIMSATLTTNGDAANVLPITTDKRGLAARYMVGIRTIEAGTVMESSSVPVMANASSSMSAIATAACSNSRIRRTLMETTEKNQTERRFADKKTLAQRYAVSERTITTWMSAGFSQRSKLGA